MINFKGKPKPEKSTLNVTIDKVLMEFIESTMISHQYREKSNLINDILKYFKENLESGEIEKIEKKNAEKRLEIPTGGTTVVNLPPSEEAGKSRDKVADVLGFKSGKSWENLKAEGECAEEEVEDYEEFKKGKETFK